MAGHNRKKRFESPIEEWADSKERMCIGYLRAYFREYDDSDKKVNPNPRIAEILAMKNFDPDTPNRTFASDKDVAVCFRSYRKVMSYINQHIVYVPSIQNFCMFMGWRDEDYKRQLSATAPPDVQSMMSVVEQYMIEQTLSAAQSGLITQAMAKMRLQTAGSHGHNLVTQKEQYQQDREIRRSLSMDELKSKLIEMGSTAIEESETDKK